MKNAISALCLIMILSSCGKKSEFEGQSFSFLCSGEEFEANKQLGYESSPSPIPDRNFFIDTANKKAEFSWVSRPEITYPVCGKKIESKFSLKDKMLAVTGKHDDGKGQKEYCSYDIDLSTGRSSLMKMNERGEQQFQRAWNMQCKKK